MAIFSNSVGAVDGGMTSALLPHVIHEKMFQDEGFGAGRAMFLYIKILLWDVTWFKMESRC
jgi:hypothetical protein